MNMNSIRFLKKVAEVKSFTKAAEELFTSQQAVSAHIKRLEQEYDTILFDRKPSLRLTEAGKLLLQAAEEIWNTEEQLTDRLCHAKEHYCGEISIGIPPNRLQAFSAWYVPQFVSQFPNMTISYIEKSSSLLFFSLQQNEVDFAIMNIRRNEELDHDIYKEHSFGVEKLYLVVDDKLLAQHFPDTFPECKKKFLCGVNLEDFANFPMFLRPESSNTHRYIIEYLQARGITPLIRVKTMQSNSMIQLCALGMGIMFCSPLVLQTTALQLFNQENNTLNVFPLNIEPAQRAVLLYHKSKYLSRPIQYSIDLMKTGFSHFFVDSQIDRQSIMEQ